MFLWEQKDNSWYGIYGDILIEFSASTTNFDSFTRSNKNATIQFSSHPEVEGWERNVFRVDDDIKKNNINYFKGYPRARYRIFALVRSMEQGQGQEQQNSQKQRACGCVMSINIRLMTALG